MATLQEMMEAAKSRAKSPALTAPPETKKAKRARTLSELVQLSKAKGMVQIGTAEDNLAVIQKIQARRESAEPTPLTKLPETEVVDEVPTTLAKLNEDYQEPEQAGIKWEQLDPSQQSAITSLKAEQFACLTGAAGTGKTTVTKILIESLVHSSASVDVNAYSKQDRELGADSKKPMKLAPSICFCAFTGRATEQIKKNLPTKYHATIMTIHTMLGFYPAFFEDEITNALGFKEIASKRQFIPWYDAGNKLPWSTIVIDEAGMVSLPLWEQLWDACKPNTRIIMIGDINQLPPVQGRSVFGYALNAWKSAELTTIHRQKGEHNPIIDNAWRVLQGKYPKSGPGFLMVDVDQVEVKDALGRKQSLEGSKHASAVLKMYVEALSQQDHFDHKSDTIIVPQNGDKPGALGYELGQIPLNAHFCLRFNPPPDRNATEQVAGRRVLVQAGYETRHFAIGDKVMVTKNDRDRGLTNGMIGTIVDINSNGESISSLKAAEIFSIDNLSESLLMHHETGHEAEEKSDEYGKRAASHVVTVNFGETLEGLEIIEPFSTVGQINSLMLAYAITCHKSQGGEYPTVVIMCHSSNHKLLYREWLYTAITRARVKVILLFNNKGLSQALRRQKIKGKTLQEKAQCFIEWSGQGVGPTLPGTEAYKS